MATFNWKCPYCGHAQAVVKERYDKQKVEIKNSDSTFGTVGAIVSTIVCANEDCKKMSLDFRLSERIHTQGAYSWKPGETFLAQRLLPESEAKPQPDYIPDQIRDNYGKACRIRDLSPEASATMSRRCLQGMIRDFWGVTGKANLAQEIEAIKNKVAPKTWEAIDAVRKVGNIGAHMEEDVNVIIDVDPGEAQLLIGLIELLLEDWYVERHEREQRVESVIAVGQQKQTAMDQAKQGAAQGAPEKATALQGLGVVPAAQGKGAAGQSEKHPK